MSIMNDQRNYNTDKYEMKYTTCNELTKEILEKSKIPEFSFEEVFSHNVTALSVCIRNRWYAWNKIEPLVEEGANEHIYNAAFPMGNAVETEVIDLIKKAGLFKGEQIRVKLVQPNISGAIDCIIHWRGSYYIIEIKSCNTNTFFDKTQWQCKNCKSQRQWNSKKCYHCQKEIPTEKVLLWNGLQSKPHFAHYCQIQMYLYAAANSNLIIDDELVVIDEGFILYYHKLMNEYKVKEPEFIAHKIQYDQTIIDWLFSKTKELEEYIEKNEIPPRQYDVKIRKGKIAMDSSSDWQCRYCSYINNCWRDKLVIGSGDKSEK